ncbi:MAG: zinc-binding dehydrogenase [Bryobacteraceae bacterium]
MADTRRNSRFARRAGVITSLANERPPAQFQLVVDSTGSASGLREAVSMVRPRGTVVMKSTVHGEIAIDSAPVIVNEITLVGSRCGRFEPAIELLREGRVDLESMLHAEYPLEQAPAAFAEAARSGVLKVLLRNDQSPRMS